MRKQYIKQLLSAFLILSIFSLSFMQVNAAPSEEIVVSEEYAHKNAKQMRYGEREVITIVKTETQSTTVVPQGQPSQGYRFPSGGAVIVNEGGGPTISVDFSLTWEIATVGVSIGSASTDTTISGLIVNFPASTDYYKVKLKKTYEFQRHKVDVYQYNEYKYTYYTTVAKHTKTDALRVKN